MAKKVVNDDLNADVLMPDFISGKHWSDYRLTVREVRDQGHDEIVQAYHASLVVIEGGNYTAEGRTSEIDESAPLPVLRWISKVVLDAMNEALADPDAEVIQQAVDAAEGDGVVPPFRDDTELGN